MIYLDEEILKKAREILNEDPDSEYRLKETKHYVIPVDKKIKPLDLIYPQVERILTQYQIGIFNTNILGFATQDGKVFINGEHTANRDSDLRNRVIQHEKEHVSAWTATEDEIRRRTGTTYINEKTL